MARPTIVITGAAGFVGSAVTVDLARDHSVAAIDRRPPSQALLDAAPEVTWHQADVGSYDTLKTVFQQCLRRFGQIDSVIHLAAFYHFGRDWRPEYQTTNVDGTANLLRLSGELSARRFLFASSIAAMLPSTSGEPLNEASPTADYIPYAKSKSIGERLVQELTGRVPAIVLRLGGVFSDWCELPPLYSLIKLWTGGTPLNRLMVGRGNTGIPYVHRDDLVRLIRRCLSPPQPLRSHEIFLGCQEGAVCHRELFPLIQAARGGRFEVRPIHLQAGLVRIALRLRLVWGLLARNLPYERPWMLDFVDRPWVVDTRYTRTTLGWDCEEGKGIRERLPFIMDRFFQQPKVWDRRNRLRNERQFSYP